MGQVAIQNISFSYGSNTLADNLSLHINAGEIVTIIGSSGCGKTSLLRMILGLERPHHGEIYVLGKPSPKGRQHVAYMMQEDLLLPWRTARDNVRLPLEVRGFTSSCDQLFHELGLGGYEDAYPHQLSGGMRQRVALARALIEKKPVLLLDEPFSSLDVVLREQLYGTLRSIRNHFGTTMMMVTHDFHDALMLSDRILQMNNGKIAHEWTISDTTRQDPSCYGSMLKEIRQTLFERATCK